MKKNTKKVQFVSTSILAFSVIASPAVSFASPFSSIPTLNTAENSSDNVLSMNDAGNIALWFIARDVLTNPQSGWSKKLL